MRIPGVMEMEIRDDGGIVRNTKMGGESMQEIEVSEMEIKGVKVGEVVLVNLTPHSIKIVRDGGEMIEIPPSGVVARARVEQEVMRKIGDIEVVKTVFKEVEGIPEPQENTIFITSSLVAQAIRRPDVVAPDTSPGSAVRNEKGHIVAVKRFQTF